MSCNYCEYQRKKSYAEKHGMSVTVIPAPVAYFPDGVDVYVHPDGTKMPNEAEREDLGWVAWYAALSDHCEC
jgi:hypothetical protein